MTVRVGSCVMYARFMFVYDIVCCVRACASVFVCTCVLTCVLCLCRMRLYMRLCGTLFQPARHYIPTRSSIFPRIRKTWFALAI